MNIITIYKKYHLPEKLQMHMLRVVACSNLIVDNWTGQEIDKEEVKLAVTKSNVGTQRCI